MKFYLLPLLFSFFSVQLIAQCDYGTGYYFEEDGDSLRFYALTIDDMPDETLYEWSFELETDVFVEYEGEEIALLTSDFSDSELDIIYVELSVTNPEDVCTQSALRGWYRWATIGCTSSPYFDYIIDGDDVHFEAGNSTNLTDLTYEWQLEGVAFGTGMDVTVPITDFGIRENIDLIASHPIPACASERSKEIYTSPEGDCALTNLSFYAIREDDSTTFYNTSENIYAGANLTWSGEFYGVFNDDSLVIPNSALDTLSGFCLKHYRKTETGFECFQNVCVSIEELSEDTICSLVSQFEKTYEEGTLYYENTSVGVMDGATFTWFVDGVAVVGESLEIAVEDATDGMEICLETIDPEGYCSDISCETILLASDTVDCSETTLAFTYFTANDSVYLVNTTEDAVFGAEFTWLVGGVPLEDDADTVGVPADLFVSGAYAHLTVNYDYDEMCGSSYAIWLTPDVIPCYSNASFTYEILGDEIALTNTTEFEPASPNYTWTVFGMGVVSTEENPVLSLDDWAPLETLIFKVEDDEGECATTEIETISGIEADCDDNELSFYYVVSDDEVTFYNTSTVYDGEDETDPWKRWLFAGAIYDAEWDETTVPVSTFDEDNSVCLILNYSPGYSVCNDSLCFEIITDIDTTIFSAMVVDFEWDIEGELVTFEPIILGASEDLAYAWDFGGEIVAEMSPTLSMSDFAGTELICLTVTDLSSSEVGDECELFDPATASLSGEQQQDYRIYPNPVSDLLYLELGGADNTIAQVEVYSIVGQRMDTEFLVTSSTLGTIHTDGLAPGMYVLVLYDQEGNQIMQERFVKK